MPRKSKSITQISYPEVRRMVADGFDGWLAAADQLLTWTLALSPAVLGVAAAPLLGLFDLKSDVVRQVGDLARKLAGRRDDFLRRGESLAAAHLLITYTAFWSAVEDVFGRVDADITLTAPSAVPS